MPAPRSRTTSSTTSPNTSSSSSGMPPRAARTSTGPATPQEATQIVTTLVQRTGYDEVIKVKSMATQEIGLVKALEISRNRRPRNRPRRDDHPALGRPPESHRGAGAPPQPGRDPPDLPRPHARRPEGPDRRPTRARGSGPPAPPTPVPQDQGRGQRRELRDRRDRRPARRRVRRQRPHVPDAAGDPDQCRRDREADPHVQRPRGVPPAAPALVDRRADEPLQLDLDGGHGKRRTADSPHRADRQRADEEPSPTKPDARRSDASAAPRA